MRISAAIFDRDGVLTTFDWAGATGELFRLTGLSAGEIVRRWRGWVSGRVIADAALEYECISDFLASLVGSVDFSDDARGALGRFEYTRFVRGYPDAAPALELARRRGLKTGLLTNNTLSISPSGMLDAAGLGGSIDVALSSQMIGAAKPDPLAYRAIAEALGVTTDACLFFDDVGAWVDGARRAGMQAYLVDRSSEPGPARDGVVRDLAELGAILDEVTDALPR